MSIQLHFSGFPTRNPLSVTVVLKQFIYEIGPRFTQLFMEQCRKNKFTLHTSYAHKNVPHWRVLTEHCPAEHHQDWDKAAADGSLSGKKFLVRLFIINTLILMSMVVAVQVHCLCLRCISLHSVRRLESWHDGAWTILEKALKKWEFSHSGGRMLIISHIQLLKSPIRFFINAFSHFCMTEGSEV